MSPAAYDGPVTAVQATPNARRARRRVHVLPGLLTSPGSVPAAVAYTELVSATPADRSAIASATRVTSTFSDALRKPSIVVTGPAAAPPSTSPTAAPARSSTAAPSSDSPTVSTDPDSAEPSPASASGPTDPGPGVGVAAWATGAVLLPAAVVLLVRGRRGASGPDTGGRHR